MNKQHYIASLKKRLTETKYYWVDDVLKSMGSLENLTLEQLKALSFLTLVIRLESENE